MGIASMAVRLEGVDACHHQVNVTRLDRKLCGHRSEDLDAYITIAVTIGKGFLDNALHNRDEALTLSPHGVLQLVNLFYFVPHFQAKLFEVLVIASIINLSARLAVVHHLVVFLLLPAFLGLSYLHLLCHVLLLEDLHQKLLQLLPSV